MHHYYYDNPDDDDFYEVEFEAERNAQNIMPRSIETWYPSDGIGLTEAIACTKIFCRKFLSLEIGEVLFKEIMPIDEALISYQENEFCKDVTFSTDLIVALKKEWHCDEDALLAILRKSL